MTHLTIYTVIIVDETDKSEFKMCSFSVFAIGSMESVPVWQTQNNNHAYNLEIQFEMGILENQNIYFVVWSPHGLHSEKVQFDADLFKHGVSGEWCEEDDGWSKKSGQL